MWLRKHRISSSDQQPERHRQPPPFWQGHLQQDDSKPRLGYGLQRHCHPVVGGRFISLAIFLSPAVGTVFMSLNTIIVAINAQLLKKKTGN
jgi:hypothetical protein